MLSREEDNYGRQKKYSVIQLNEYKSFELNSDTDLFTVYKYLIYSDGSVRIKLYWRHMSTTEGEKIHDFYMLPFNIDTNKYNCVTITQSDTDVWHNGVAYKLFNNKIDLYINSYSSDHLSILEIDIFTFI